MLQHRLKVRVWRESCQVLGGEPLDSSTGSRGQHQLALPSSSSSGQQAKALMNEAWVDMSDAPFTLPFLIFFESVECGRCFLHPVRLGPMVLEATESLFAQAEIPQKRRPAEPGTAAWQVGIRFNKLSLGK